MVKVIKSREQKDYNKGGIRMTDFQSFKNEMKWIKGYLDDTNHGK